MAKAPRRVGRPTKPPMTARRVSLGLKVTAETKLLIDALAQSTGRTQSQQCEYLVERALQYERTVSALRTSLENMKRHGIETELRHEGWQPIRSVETPIPLWAPPGHPWNRQSGFEPWTEEEKTRRGIADEPKGGETE